MGPRIGAVAVAAEHLDASREQLRLQKLPMLWLPSAAPQWTHQRSGIGSRSMRADVPQRQLGFGGWLAIEAPAPCGALP